MATHTLRLIRPDELPAARQGTSPEISADPDELEAVNRDAAAMRGGGAVGLLRPRTEGALGQWLREHPDTPLLAQGALTSLTGGATPDRDVVVSLGRMTGIAVDAARSRVTVGAGVLLANLQAELADRSLYYPPAPTHDGASIGGNVATNAAGAATFKYGTTRDWVERIRVVLRHGDVLELERGTRLVNPGDRLLLEGTEVLEIPVPTYTSPALKKSAAGYFVEAPLDPIDLVIGAEGTLGFITEIELRLVARPRTLTGLVMATGLDQAIALTGELRARSAQTRATDRPEGLDVRSIELFDRRCLDLLRREGKLEALPLDVPEDAAACLLFEQELATDLTEQALLDRLADALEGRPRPADPVGELVSVLASFELVERTEIALPSQTRRQKQLADVREAIPLTVSDWLVRQQKSHPEIHKVAGDMIVPFERFGEMMAHYYDAFERRGVDLVVFGHVSDGNVHPNSLPADPAQMEAATAALLELADTAKRLGGCPLSEHGVGKHPLKKAMLARFWGAEVIAQMRSLKRGFDPGWTLGRGVYFDP